MSYLSLEGNEGAEIIPHELDRYHERVRSRYEIIRNHPQQTVSTELTFRVAISRIQTSKLKL